MRYFFVALLSALTLCFFPRLSMAQDSIITTLNALRPAVVKITAYHPQIVKNMRRGLSYQTGAGIIISADGHIITNTHIIMGSNKIRIDLSDGTFYSARVLKVIPGFDASILKITAPQPLHYLNWASGDDIALRREIVHIGNSYLLDGTYTMGMITRLMTDKHDQNDIPDLVETNIPLFKGDSGGPLLNRNGDVVGMIAARHSQRYRSSFAISFDKIRQHYLEVLGDLP